MRVRGIFDQHQPLGSVNRHRRLGHAGWDMVTNPAATPEARSYNVVMGFQERESEKLLAATGRRCCICGLLHRVQLHHIIPREEGGTDDIENAIPLCPNCHDEVHRKPRVWQNGARLQGYGVAAASPAHNQTSCEMRASGN